MPKEGIMTQRINQDFIVRTTRHYKYIDREGGLGWAFGRLPSRKLGSGKGELQVGGVLRW